MLGEAKTFAHECFSIKKFEIALLYENTKENKEIHLIEETIPALAHIW